MPQARMSDGVQIFYEDTGSGTPIIFVHEFAGDHRAWEPQVRYLSRRYRCITFNARGFPPSDVPGDGHYSQERARDDIRDLMDALSIDKAHVIGLSMGGFATLHFGFAYPDRAHSLVVAGCGYGAEPDKREQFAREANAQAERFAKQGMEETAQSYMVGPTRVQFQNADPRGWAESLAQLSEHSAEGSANTMRGVQARRPSLFELTEPMKALTVPTLVMTGDEDWPCLEPALLMKRLISSAGLVVMPNAGHAINLEDPGAFNAHVADFLHTVTLGAWPMRDERARLDTILGSADDDA